MDKIGGAGGGGGGRWVQLGWGGGKGRKGIQLQLNNNKNFFKKINIPFIIYKKFLIFRYLKNETSR